jgi:FMN phosphatase YigB (HAD superfamily)
VKTPLLLDFDRTLFDFDTWLQQYFAWLADRSGTSVTLVERCAQRTRDGVWYDMFAHADILDLPYEHFEPAFTEHLAHSTPQHIFPETIHLLTNLNRDRWEPAIITAGHRGGQRRKVEPLSLPVDTIHYSGKVSKASYLLSLGMHPESEFVFVDDAPSWCQAVRDTFPNARCYNSLPEVLASEALLRE